MRPFTAAEVEAIAAELSPTYQPLPIFAAATGLRPEEWQALERRDIDRAGGVLNVRRTVSSGEVVELGKTNAQPPPGAAVAARPRRPRRAAAAARHAAAVPGAGVAGCSTWTTSAAASGHRRSRHPACGTPARIYDLRSTFASTRSRPACRVFELARDHGHTVQMIERHYGTLLDGSGAEIAGRLDAFEAAGARGRGAIGGRLNPPVASSGSGVWLRRGAYRVGSDGSERLS